jgi:hypothetical protein
MPNEVLIYVRARNETKTVFDAVRRDARALGDEIGVDLTTRVNTRIEQEARGGTGYARAGDAIGDAIGRRVTERVNERLRDSRGRFISGGKSERISVDVDVDKPSFLSRMAGLGKEAGDKLTSGIGTAMSGFFSGDIISLILKGIAGGGLVATLSPVLGAAFTSALGLAVGGGVLGAGISAAFKDPKIKASAKGLGDELKAEFATWGQHFTGPVQNFMDRLKNDVGPQLKPIADTLGEIFGPISGDLGDGIIGFLQNSLPGLARFAESSAPLWKTLAESLPKLGDDLALFFDHLREGMPQANVFLNDFISGLGLLLRGLGKLMAFLAHAYVGIRMFWIDFSRTAINAFDKILVGAAIAFQWVPGLGPKLKTAAAKFHEFRISANKELDKLEDETVTITIRQVFKQIGDAVVGAALDVVDILSSSKFPRQGVGKRAAGGVAGGLTWVGENGPELVNLPSGSTVRSNADSMRMAGSGNGGGGMSVVQLVLDGAVLAEALMDPQRNIVRTRYAGSVQKAYGYSA